jgi:hypothetical protein
MAFCCRLDLQLNQGLAALQPVPAAAAACPPLPRPLLRCRRRHRLQPVRKRLQLSGPQPQKRQRLLRLGTWESGRCCTTSQLPRARRRGRSSQPRSRLPSCEEGVAQPSFTPRLCVPGCVLCHAVCCTLPWRSLQALLVSRLPLRATVTPLPFPLLGGFCPALQAELGCKFSCGRPVGCWQAVGQVGMRLWSAVGTHPPIVCLCRAAAAAARLGGGSLQRVRACKCTPYMQAVSGCLMPSRVNTPRKA